MNNFLLSKNPPAVWKTALRILSIAMLSFLFISEGWGLEDQALNVSTLSDNRVHLTYSGTGWGYRTEGGSVVTNFNGTLTTGGSTAERSFYITIQNNTDETTTAELKLNNFHYSSRNGVFRIIGSFPIKITAENACTLENKGMPIEDEDGELPKRKSVIYVSDGSNVELDGGSGVDNRMTIRNLQEKSEIKGLWNQGTTTLSGKINFIAKNGAESPAYAIVTPGDILKTSGNAEIEAIGEGIYYSGYYQSPFMCWTFENAPADGSTIAIKEEGVETPRTFTGDGQSTTFLILGKKNASYTVSVNGEKQMGKKQTGNGIDACEKSYTNTFAATTEASGNNQHSFYVQVTQYDPSKIDLDLSTVTGKLTLNCKEKAPGYIWSYKIGADGSETDFSGTLEGKNEAWTHGAITISGNKTVTSADGSDYPILKLDGVTLASDDPLIEMTAGSQPVRLQAINTSILEGDGNVINITGSSILLDGSNKGLKIIGTGPNSHGIHLTGTNSKAIFAGQVTVHAAVPAHLADGAKLSANTDATVLLSSSADAAISLDGTNPGSVDSPFLEWRFATAQSGTLEVVRDASGMLLPVIFTTGSTQSFATNVTLDTKYTLWLNATKQQKGKLLTGGTTSDYTELFQVSTTGEKHVVYTDIALYRQIASGFSGLKDIIDNVPANETNPTKILLTEDIDLTSRLESYGKHIEIDGGGNTIKPSYGYENFIFPADGGNSSLTLTNITVDCQNTASERTHPFINVKDPNTTITLGDGFKMKGGESSHGNEIIKVYGINMQAGTLIMKEGAVIEGNTDKKGAAIGITSGATLKLEGGKIKSTNGSTGLYLLRKEGATENPTVTIENDLPEGSVFEGVYLADYIDADGKITKKEVITAGGSHTISAADLNKFTLMTVRQAGGTILSDYELYLDTDNNNIKLRKFPLFITAPTFDGVTVDYPQPAAKPITIKNTTDNEITITSVTLANSNTNFTITEPTSGDEKKVPVDNPNTHYTIRPVAGLTEGTYTATIEVTTDGRTYKADVSFTVGPKPTPPPPPPAPVPTYYQVVLPEVEGATTDPVAGNYEREEWDSFRFYLTLDEGYRVRSKPVVTTDRNETIEPRQPDGAYLVKSIRQDVVISISGIVPDTPTANAEIENATLIRVVDGTLYITVPQPTDLFITDLAGRLHRSRRLFTGETRIEGLSDGMYILKLEGQKARKVIIR